MNCRRIIPSFTFVFAVLFFTPSILVAQVPDAPSAETETVASPEDKDKQAAKEALKKKTLDLLLVVQNESESLSLQPNKIFVGFQLIRPLAAIDREQSDRLFRDTVNRIIALKQANQNREESDRSEALVIGCNSAYGQVIELVGEFNPKLAYETLQATKPAMFASEDVDLNQELNNLELALFGRLNENDPQKLIASALKELNQGNIEWVLAVASKIQAAEPQAARNLLAGIIENLRQRIQTDPTAADMAFRIESIVEESGSERPFGMDESLRRELLSVLVQGVTSKKSTFSVELLRSVLEENTHLTPAQTQALKSKITELEREKSDSQKKWEAKYDFFQNTNIDDILKAAPKAEDPNEYYRAAFNKALSEDAFQQARQIAESHVADERQRREWLKELEQRETERSLEKATTDETLTLLSRVKSKDEKLRILLGLVEKELETDRTKAAAILEQAHALIGGQRTNWQMAASLQLIQMQAELNPEQAFQDLRAVVAGINTQADAMAVLAEFADEEHSNVANGEFQFNDSPEVMEWTTNLSLGLARLAEKDYDRALSEIESIRRPEWRITARLTFAFAVASLHCPEIMYPQAAGDTVQADLQK